MTDSLGYTYSILIAGGGLAGYVTAGSVMSLVMGLLCGALAALGAWRLSVRADSYILGLLVSLAMAGRFGQAFYKTGQVWPALVEPLFHLNLRVDVCLEEYVDGVLVGRHWNDLLLPMDVRDAGFNAVSIGHPF